MNGFLGVVVIFVISLHHSIGVKHSILLINVVGHEREELQLAISNTIQFLESLSKISNFWNDVECRLFSYRAAFLDLSPDLKSKLSKFADCISSLSFYNRTSLPDKNIAKNYKEYEQVSVILESFSILLHPVSQHHQNIHTKIISIAISDNNRLVATKDFPNIFHHIGSLSHPPGTPSAGISSPSFIHGIPTASVVMLGKNRRMTSVSDWQDLTVLGLAVNMASKRWVHTLTEVYRHHAADREAFTLLDPRPAILEASLRMRPLLRVGYFRRGDVCVTRNRGGAIGECKGRPLLEVTCASDRGTTKEAKGKDVVQRRSYPGCSVVEEPNTWKHSFDRSIDSLERKLHTDRGDWGRGLVKHIDWGTARFMLARITNKSSPLPFCWDTNSTTDYATKSRIFESHDKSVPLYNYTADEAGRLRTHDFGHLQRSRIVVMSGSHGTGYEVDYRLYPVLAKLYYCHRHGYTYVNQLSNQMVPYFHPSLFEAIKGGIGHTGEATFKGTMSKVVMLIDVLLRYPEAEWVVWMDDDTWLNPGFLHLPLETFLQDVPPEKLVVQSNYRSMFTNLVFWRNSEAGRRLAYDWLAVATSGYVQCHGFDQAALQMLAVLRLRGSFDPKPLGMSCVWTYDGNQGCNEKGDYSCDFDFEAALYDAGYRSRSSRFHNGKISSFSKGCANEYFPDFHIITETENRPRLQCCYCFNLDRIEAGHCFDGPLCGGNDWLRRGAVNGWFAGHKEWWFFFESYLRPGYCTGVSVKDFVPSCRPEKIASFLQDPKANKGLLSLADGFAYDFDDGGPGYCRVNEAMLNYQKKHSYMREYDLVMQALGKVKAEEVKDDYENEVQRVTQRQCYGGKNQCKDGLFIKPAAGDFEQWGYCESSCKVVENKILMGLPADKRYAWDCLK